MDYAIKLTNVSKVYKLYSKPSDRIKELFIPKYIKHENYLALNNVSFELKKGETLGIIGKNGAGKSTLLKIITGVSTPTSGNVETNGNISALLELGTGFNPEYTGIENIYLNGTMRGYSHEQMKSKIDEIIAFADIGEYINQPVKMYSSGMFARLAFSVMISFKPEILIVDEALSVGDVFFQQKCNTYMKENMKDVTKLLVTHDMNSIANMADRVMLIDNGAITKVGRPLEVIEHYLKILHNSSFEKGENASAENSKIENLPKLNDSDGWVEVNDESIGGAKDAKIISVYTLVNNNLGSVVKPGDKLTIKFKLSSQKTIYDLICGYIIKDKYGNSIFGQNTLGANIKPNIISSGNSYCISFCFDWPEIIEGDYFLTLGIGEGTDEMVHIIQCWAHNVIHFNAISLKPMHGIINHSINNFKVKELLMEDK